MNKQLIYQTIHQLVNKNNKLTQKIIGILSSKIKISAGFIEDIKIPLNMLNMFKANIKEYLLKPLRGFNDILKPLFDIIDSLGFLITIADFKVPLPYPKFKGVLYPPFFTVSMDTVYFGLEEIGNIVKVSAPLRSTYALCHSKPVFPFYLLLIKYIQF